MSTPRTLNVLFVPSGSLSPSGTKRGSSPGGLLFTMLTLPTSSPSFAATHSLSARTSDLDGSATASQVSPWSASLSRAGSTLSVQIGGSAQPTVTRSFLSISAPSRCTSGSWATTVKALIMVNTPSGPSKPCFSSMFFWASCSRLVHWSLKSCSSRPSNGGKDARRTSSFDWNHGDPYDSMSSDWSSVASSTDRSMETFTPRMSMCVRPLMNSSSSKSLKFSLFFQRHPSRMSVQRAPRLSAAATRTSPTFDVSATWM
mmetsp:Transcript_96443/g.273097  ORF Transcript_96443/g.273097 Transcript_96443/m.273097 type:complete len:258 (+) Transcript_96443:371-1144(+)